MTEEKRIFEFEGFQTASARMAEAFTCIRQLETAAEAGPDETAPALSERLGAAAGLVSRLKHALNEFLRETRGVDLDDAPENSLAGRAAALVSEIADQAFLPPSGTFSDQDLRERLKKADFLASKLPFLMAGLDAGEDLSENKTM